MACTRKSFSVKEKAEIVFKIEKGSKQADICREYSLQKSTVATIWKNRETIKRAYEQNTTKVKKLRKPTRDDVDSALLKWFTLQRSRNVAISGPLLQVKANEFAKLFDIEDFACSQGWIDRFKKRHNITFGAICGEAADVDISLTDAWTETFWQEIRKDYNDNDIFNADETGLFYKMTPNKTHKFKKEKCVGGKQAKDRITVLVCANMTGNEKRKLLVIGKSARPRCLKNVKHLPVTYKSNKKAWMTSDIFEEHIRSWDKELRNKNRKILLLVDNCPSHPELKNLTNIKLVFLPPNTTSILQPMDQGVIKNLKLYYRKSLIIRMIDCLDRGEKFTINVYDAINLIAKAWLSVTQKTILHSYFHSKLAVKPANEEDAEEDIPLFEWLQKNQLEVKILPEKNIILDYAECDNDLIICEYPADEDIAASINNNDLAVDEEDEESDSDNEECHPMPTTTDAMTAVKIVTRFLQNNDADPSTINSALIIENEIDRLILSKRVRQTKVTEFFST